MIDFVECEYCLYDEQDCNNCMMPEFTDEEYRDTCDMCHEFIMMPYNVHDYVSLVVCKKCSKTPYEDMSVPIGTCEGVYVEGMSPWWKDSEIEFYRRKYKKRV